MDPKKIAAMAFGAAEKAAAKQAKEAGEAAAAAVRRTNRVAEHVDRPSAVLADWEWKQLSEPAAKVNATAVPDYIQKGYGDFMLRQAARAARNDLNKRDLLKAYGITQSSIGRGGLSHATATKAGLPVAPTSELVRPEGAFADWLASPMGQRYLRAAEQGLVDPNAINDIVQKFAPFGKQNVLGDALTYGAEVLANDPRDINAIIRGGKDQYRDFAGSLQGIDQSKAGFIGSLLGRGDLPTLDARQLNLHTTPPTTVKTIGTILKRGKGSGGKEAVDRLIDRQEAMALDLDPSLDPFYQHLTHHTAWDRALGEETTHDDLIRAMTEYAQGGEVHMSIGGDIAKNLFKGVKNTEKGILDSVRAAGRVAHNEQAAFRAAKDAEIAEMMAKLPPRNKEAAVAAGLYHPVGGGLKISKPVSGMHATTVADPKFKQPEIKIITPEQLAKEGAALVPLVGDRAAAGRYLTHIGENEFANPVPLTGGPRYMDANYNHLNPEDSAAWESGANVVGDINKALARAGEGGRPAYGIYMAGSGTNTDFNTMGANAIFQQLPYSKITKKAEDEFNQAMKEASANYGKINDWPGILNPELELFLSDKSKGVARTKLMELMAKEKFQSMGFPDVAATRKAIIEPDLLDVPTHQMGYRLAKMDTNGRIIKDPIAPSSYPISMAGQLAGQLDSLADYKDLFPSYFAPRRLFGSPEKGDYRAFSLSKPIQYADDEWLNKLMEQRRLDDRIIKEGKYNDGGEVHQDDESSTIDDLLDGLYKGND